MSRFARLLPIATCMIWAGCSGLQRDTGSQGVASPPATSVEPATRTGSAASERALRAALAAAARAPGSRPPLHLLAECRPEDGGGMRSIEVFDSGVAIQDGRRQILLDAGVMEALLAALDAVDFAAFADTYGRLEEERERPPRPGGHAALIVVCRVKLTLGEAEKQSVQLSEGEQSATLRALAERLLELCEGAALSGVEAADLDDGLRKLAHGRLAPETLALVFHRKPGSRPPEGPGDGLLLRLEGRTATSRTYDPAAGYGRPRRLDLSRDDVRDLAARLAAADPGDLPVNLWAAEYTDVSLRVLDHRVSLQARRFAGMTPATHAAEQERFARLLSALNALHGRVMSDGILEAPAPPRDAPGSMHEPAGPGSDRSGPSV